MPSHILTLERRRRELPCVLKRVPLKDICKSRTKSSPDPETTKTGDCGVSIVIKAEISPSVSPMMVSELEIGATVSLAKITAPSLARRGSD